MTPGRVACLRYRVVRLQRGPGPRRCGGQIADGARVSLDKASTKSSAPVAGWRPRDGPAPVGSKIAQGIGTVPA